MKSVAEITVSLKEDYKSVPGVVEIQPGYSKNSIIIFVDRSKLKSVLPSNYQGLDIVFYDLLGVYDASKDVLKKIDSSSLDNEQNKITFDYLTKTLTLCEKLLRINEIPKKT